MFAIVNLGPSLVQAPIRQPGVIDLFRVVVRHVADVVGRDPDFLSVRAVTAWQIFGQPGHPFFPVLPTFSHRHDSCLIRSKA
jgi:hypothetical protein